MPSCNEHDFNKTLCMIWPFPGMIFVLWALDVIWIFNFQVIGTIIATSLSYYLYTNLKDLKDKQVPR